MTTPAQWWPGGDQQAGRIPLSALEHYAYCPRQAALIHLDSVFTDNIDTVRGNIAHDRVHQPSPPARASKGTGIRMVTGVPVWSDQLGLYGICDVIELTADSAVPIEHKVGRYVAGGPADVQAAAQAICLREMLTCDVPHAEVFSHADRRRHRIELTNTLLARVAAVAESFRSVLRSDRLPDAVADRRCRNCSLRSDCLPDLVASRVDQVDIFVPRQLGDWHD